MICPEYLILGLEQVFDDIQRLRMQGVPVLNPALQVEAVAFTSWQDHCLGVLITPWFMNLVLLPNEADEWTGLAVGAKVRYQFPSGAYEFIVGYEDDVGRYQTCSLFSPMFEFVDQEAAVATAEAVMQGLMNEENRDLTSMRDKEVARIWRGETEEQTPVEMDDAVILESSPVKERLHQPITRRELLRGHFLRED